MKLKKPNRLRSKQPTKAKYWCGCDRRLVGHSGRCPRCGSTEKGRKLKKPGPLE